MAETDERSVLVQTLFEALLQNSKGRSVGKLLNQAEDLADKHLTRFARDKRVVKFTEGEILSIRRDSRPAEEVAKDYGCSPSAIRGIRQGKTYKHVPMPERMPTWRRGRAARKDEGK